MKEKMKNGAIKTENMTKLKYIKKKEKKYFLWNLQCLKLAIETYGEKRKTKFGFVFSEVKIS